MSEDVEVTLPFEDGGARSTKGLSKVGGAMEWVVDVGVSMPDFDGQADLGPHRCRDPRTQRG